MNKRLIGSGVLTVFVLLGIWMIYIGSSSATITGNAIYEEDGVKVFVVDSSHLRFYIDGEENPDIVVTQGDKVRIEFSSSEGRHDWVLDEFNASTARVSPGNKTYVEFTADKKGTFEYYCSVGKHRENGMKGRFIVK